MRLSTILDQVNAGIATELPPKSQLVDLAVQMHQKHGARSGAHTAPDALDAHEGSSRIDIRQDGLRERRERPALYGPQTALDAHEGSSRIDIRQDGLRAGPDHGEYRGERGHWGGDDLVSRSDSQGAQGDLDGVQAIADADRMLRANDARPFGLK